MLLFTAVYYLALFGPLLLLTFVWRKLLSSTTDKTVVVIATLISLTYAYLMAALFFRSALLGGDYSKRLFVTVQMNTLFALCLSILSVIWKSPIRALLTCSALAITLAWFLVWVVNATV
jgi:hypothetical protein